jgi:hypothetical protein
LLPAEQKSLLELFASADASNLANEIEPHKEALALAFRGSAVQALAKGSASDMVSALQQRSGVLEEVISSKKDQLRKKNDGKNSTSFPDDFEVKDTRYILLGGRCRTGREYDDIDFESACIALCDADSECKVSAVEAGGLDANSTEPDVCKQDHEDGNDWATGAGLNEADTCAELCSMDDMCTSSEFEEGVCKRFNWNMKSYKRSTLLSCGKRCAKYDDCVAFEWDNGECELHDNSTDSSLSAAEEIGDENVCYSKTAPESEDAENKAYLR